MKTFGRLILETRKAARLTQKAVASLFGAEKVAKFTPYVNDLEHHSRYSLKMRSRTSEVGAPTR
jgi:hypothetical protein